MTAKRPRYPAWMYRQSAALPYREHGAGLEVMLVTSRKGKHWILPKGIVEPGLTPRASAAKEALEEAGVAGDMAAEPLGSYRHRKWGGTCDVDVYPLRVRHEMDDWPESGIRRRRWQPLATALRQVDDAGLRAVIAGLPDAASSPAPDVQPAGDERVAPGLLYLLRHAKSSWEFPDLDDVDRPLAPRGERAGDRMKRFLDVADIRPELVLCSPARRAQQTLERVLPALGDQAVVETSPDLYLRGPRAILDRLRTTDADVASVMVVGHNPDMQALATLLTGSGDEAERARLERKFPTGALATLVTPAGSWVTLGPGTCELHSLTRPRDLRVDRGS